MISESIDRAFCFALGMVTAIIFINSHPKPEPMPQKQLADYSCQYLIENPKLQRIIN